MPAPAAPAPIATPAACHGLPAHWQEPLQQRLQPGETALAALAIDLDDALHYGDGVLVLTDRRLLARLPHAAHWQDWTLTSDLRLHHGDHAGVGQLELVDARRRLFHCRFTLDQNLAALRLLSQFERLQKRTGDARATHEDEDSLCPICKAPLPPDEDDCPACVRELHTPPSTWTLLRLWRFARPYRGALLAGFLLTLASTGATLVPPYLTMPLMDKVLIPFQNGQPIDQRLVLMLLGGILGSALLAWFLGWARTYILALVSERIGCDLRTVTYEHLLTLSLEYFGAKRTGDLLTRIGSESDRICLYLSLHLLDFATDVLMLAMIAAILFSINPMLALVTLLPLPLIAWLIQLVRNRLRTGFEKIDRAWSELSSVLADTIPGIRVVKAFAQEGRETRRFREANRHYLAINDRLNKVWSLFTPTVTLLTELGLIVVWAFGIWQVSRHQITVGVLTAFLAYIGRFYTRLDSMSRIVSVTQKAAAGAKRIFDILDHVSSVPEPARPVPLPAARGALTLRDVGFRYGNRGVIRGLDLEIRPGEMIGLVGHSGSGKTTLVNLICRFYDVTQGAILVDGIDIRSVALADYRRHIGLVLQEPFLFFGTIAENIAYGRPDASREEIVAAARAAHAHEFILRLPHGYDSLVGERGQGLSGGERQRISIARAADRPALFDPGRGHLVGGHRDREGNPARAGQPGAGPHHPRHRPSPVHPAQGRPAGGDGARADRGSGPARRADGAPGRVLAAVPGAAAQRGPGRGAGRTAAGRSAA
ncbi:ATP-binding cassette domain-containing protein [Thermomonas sp. S9]|uniref:cyanophycin metabolism-associated ABC transporter n=1 Tax=Thermomonas sp. S9 TaxID=2885203 RepID=UPI00216AFACD|nr:ABC transporter transmembrane domain-containing protein [Thermomonas sp. S9]MCR6496425.1 ATP-binding cassette domain-containing protein [Thermomonas sp. S9]